MSGALRKIRDQIKSVKNTQKITSAMKLVATSKMKKFQDKAMYTRKYALNLLSMAEKIMYDMPSHKYFEKRNEGSTLFILYTSDRGLCGSLNTQLIRTLFNSERWNSLDSKDRKLLVIGKRGYNYCYYNNIKVDAHFPSIDENFGALEALHFVGIVLEYWNIFKCKEVVMIVPHYKNALVNYPVFKTYLPFSKDMLKSHIIVDENLRKEFEDLQKNIEETMIYEPTKTRIFKRVIEHLLEVMFISAFNELKASEYSSRMIAMQNATDAAQKIVDNLSLDLNKARQAKITQEIAELVSGAASLESNS